MARLRHRLCWLLMVLAAIGGGRVLASPAASSTLRKVVLQTDWFPQGEHGGFYQALAKGYYRHAGLDVEILEGGPGSGIKVKVARGDADFGMNRSDDIILAAGQGVPLVIVAATLQHDPQALMVHADSPVKTLRDLQGRTLIANVHMPWIPYLQNKYGITFDLIPNTYELGTFLADKNAIKQCLVTNEPYFAAQRGVKVRTLSLAEAGYDCYHVIFCRRELIRSAPEVVTAFVAASIRGWRDYLEGDPAPANALILKRNPQMSAGQLAFSRGELIERSLVQGDRTKGEDIGKIDLKRVSKEIQILLDLKVLETPVAVSAVATTNFLPKAETKRTTD